MPSSLPRIGACIVLAACMGLVQVNSQQPPTFRATVDAVNIVATVTDQEGRFVPGLLATDFVVFEDDQQQTISHFSSEAVPISLGVLVDVSASMFNGAQMSKAGAALSQLASGSLRGEDEIFMVEFTLGMRRLIQGWTTDRTLIMKAFADLLERHSNMNYRVLNTGIYDAVAAAIPTLSAGKHPKKLLLILSGGARSDRSAVPPTTLRRILREADTLVYAFAVDGGDPRISTCMPPTCVRAEDVSRSSTRKDPRALLRANVRSLEVISNETGGRTDEVQTAGDLEKALKHLSTELTHQYLLGYQRNGKTNDGLWHPIRVVVRDGSLSVRARQGYFAR